MKQQVEHGVAIQVWNGLSDPYTFCCEAECQRTPIIGITRQNLKQNGLERMTLRHDLNGSWKFSYARNAMNGRRIFIRRILILHEGGMILRCLDISNFRVLGNPSM